MDNYNNINDNNINDNRKELLNIRASVDEDKNYDRKRQIEEDNSEIESSSSNIKVLALLACMAAVIIGVLIMVIVKSFASTTTGDIVEIEKEDLLLADKDKEIEVVGGGDIEEIQFNEDNVNEELKTEELDNSIENDLSEVELQQEQLGQEQATEQENALETSSLAPEKNPQTEKDKIKDKIQKLSLVDGRVVNIYNNFSRYPLNLMNDIIRNNEMIDYAAGYLDGIKKSYDENIDISNSINYGEYKIPLLIQWDTRWGYYSYGKSTIGISGCGPTALNMVYLALKGDITMNPLKMAKFSTENGYCVPGVGTSWSLMSEGANRLGLQSRRLSNKESLMIESLQQGKLIIGSMGPGTFTDKGHFIVFSGYENGKFRINDPFCVEHSRKKWDYSEFGKQIKALWVFSQ